MTNVGPDEEAIFTATRQIADPDARAAYLSRACGGDDSLRARVEALLKVHDEQHSFLQSNATAHPALNPPLLFLPVGTVIGRYKLLEPIGEGGYGAVFMAEQTSPVQRKVALKIIKAGMDTRQVIARFEAERQALALMDHPNIAKVFDAGTTEAGRPYFVMELVKGMAITKYCDQHHLSPRARLELFVQVCQAVQHAHTKGIIHRDLKPSNVLVALYDGKPVPKVIDFGVAKATGQKLTDRTMFTGFGDVIGTLEYMSPEQAEMNQLDVDTRSDIYSLGVLLYELLTGSTPLEKERIKQTALLDALRFVREEEPQIPSTRLMTAQQLPSIAANRGLEPKKLSGLVRGELDWIVMRALEKDRARRYETANGLAQDIRRYLADEEVAACPPSAGYRMRKFARRNKVALSGTALVLLCLMLLGGGIGWTMRSRAARQARVSGQLEFILDEVARLEQAQKWSEALTAARRAEPALATGEAPPDVQHRASQALIDLGLIRRLERIRAEGGTVWMNRELAAQANVEYAAAFRQAGMDLDALPVNESVRLITSRGAIAAALLPALDDWLAVRIVVKNFEVRNIDRDEASTRRLIDVLAAADPDPWRQKVREAIASKDQPALANLVTSADLDRQSAATSTFLYAALWASGNHREQELILRRAQWKYPSDYWINLRLGVDLIWYGTLDSARDGIGFLRVAVALRPEDAESIMNLGNGYDRLGQYDEAIACYRKAIELEPSSNCYGNLAGSLDQTGRYEEAVTAFEQAIKLNPISGGSHYADLSMIHSNCPDTRLRNLRRASELAARAVEIEPQASNNWTALGVAFYRQGQWPEARSAFEKSLELATDSGGGDFRWSDSVNWFFLAMSDWQLGEHDQARQWYDRAVEATKKELSWGTDVEQLRHTQAEAAQLLKVTDKKAATKALLEVK